MEQNKKAKRRGTPRIYASKEEKKIAYRPQKNVLYDEHGMVL